MSHVDPTRPTMMPAYPLGSPPGAELLDPEEDPQTAHPPAASPQLLELVQLEVPSAGPLADGDEEWTVQAETDPTHHVRRR